MKRLLLILMLLSCFRMATFAQSGLNVAPFFGKEYVRNPNVTIVSMSDCEVESLKIEKFRSMTVADDPQLADKIAGAVAKDGVKAVSKEENYKRGMLYFGFFSLGRKNSMDRYLLYLNRRPVGKEKTTLIYIEGILNADEVRKLISK